MVKYKCRPGIVLTKICGQYVLIPTRAASEVCPHVLRLTLPAVFLWGAVKSEKPMSELEHAIKILTKKTDEETREMLQKMLDGFVEKKLLIPVEEEA